MHTVKLSRAEHDALITSHPGLIRQLFFRYTRSWNLQGVTFYGVPDEVIATVAEAVKAAPQPHQQPVLPL